MFSPAIGFAVTINIFVVLHFIGRAGLILKKRDLTIIFLLVLITVLSILTKSFNEFAQDMGRICYILSCLFFTRFFPQVGTVSIKNTFLLIVLVDLVFRLTTKNIGFYSLKSSLIFVDTNFLSLIFICMILPIFSYVKMHIKVLYTLIVIGFLSRASWLIFLYNTLFFKYKWIVFFAIGLIFFASAMLPQELLPLLFQDNSFATKLQIFDLAVLVALYDPVSLLFGYGKEGVYDAIEVLYLGRSEGIAVTYRGGFTVGHTFIGLIVELGVIYISAIIYMVNYFIVPGYRTVFWLSIFISGILSLFPLTYLGMCVLLYNNSVHIITQKKVMLQKKPT